MRFGEQASSGDGSGSFTVYAADSIDQIAASARALLSDIVAARVGARAYLGAGVRLRSGLVDEQGQLAAAGLLQVRGRQGALQACARDASLRREHGGFGAVCGINSGAANVVCRMLGYNGGAVGSSPCGAYGGANMCGAVGSRAAMKNLKCRGDEMDLASCGVALARGRRRRAASPEKRFVTQVRVGSARRDLRAARR